MSRDREKIDFFVNPYEIRGKHATMAKELWKFGKIEQSFFARLMDLYMIAAIVGFRMNRKVKEDKNNTDSTEINSQQLGRSKADLEYILQMMIMLEEAEHNDPLESAKLALCGAKSREKYGEYFAMFNDYVRGGIEELYEKLILRNPDMDEEYYEPNSANIIALLKRFAY